MLGTGIRAIYVTHRYDLARGFHTEPATAALFLRAERRPDGRRTFRLAEAEPLPTSHGRTWTRASSARWPVRHHRRRHTGQPPTITAEADRANTPLGYAHIG
jgi:hypothetical protein